MGIGDPACDLMILWQYFKQCHRDYVKSKVCFIDDDMLIRSRSWALWKALVDIRENNIHIKIKIIENIMN